MEFEKRKAATLASMSSPEPDNSPKGTIDTPIIPLLTAINSHPSYFTTSSCSGRISIFSQPINPNPASKKKAKGGSWLFISHSPVDPTSVLPLLFPSSSIQSSYRGISDQEFQDCPHSLVFKFEPLIIAVECKDIEAAQFLVSLAISRGFRESGITNLSKRVIIAIRCSIRLEVPLGDTEKIMVSSEYVRHLIEVANEKMEANRKRTDSFLDALLKNGFSGGGRVLEHETANGELGCDEDSGCYNSGKVESLGNSVSCHEDNSMDGEKRSGLDDSQSGSSQLPISPIIVVGEPVERLFLWGHSACTLDNLNHEVIVIFGGFGGIGRHARRNDLLLLDGESGKIQVVNVQGAAPCPRMGHTSNILGDSMYVIGGRADPLSVLNDVWVFRMGTKEWSLLQCSGSQFSPRHRHAAAVMGSKIYIFGGVDNNAIVSSLFVLDMKNLQWTEIPIKGEWPSPRHSHSMLAYGDHLYMFGGCDGEKALGDLYAFNVQICEWKKLNMDGRKPTARFSHSMFIFKNYLGIIGGCPVSQHHQELSLLDLHSFLWKHFMVDSTGTDLFVCSTASILGDELVMIGGGASCYAFGTKFSEPTKINLLPLMPLTQSREKHIHCHEKGSTHKNSDSCQLSDMELKLIGNGSLKHDADVEDFDVKTSDEMVVSYWVLRLERRYAKFGKDILKKFGWLDPSRQVCSQEAGKYICFPVIESFWSLFTNTLSEAPPDLRPDQPSCAERFLLKDVTESTALNTLMECGATKLEDEFVKLKKGPISPLKAMKEAVASLVAHRGLPTNLLDELPSRWQRLGDIVVLPVTSFKDPAWNLVGKELWPVVAKSIGTDRLAQQGLVASTGTRDSTLEILVGDNGWVEHRENGILYSFDATKCMFSWGNLSEKLRMARLECRDEVIVDLFAGIGYFTLPFLVRANAKLVYACEWNPHAVEALHRNLCANNVADCCVILEGDNRITAPKGVADRVCLGLLPSSEGSWITAVRALRSDGGVLHIHGNVKDTEEYLWTDHVSKSINSIARSEGYSWEVSVVHVERVKWYAPHIRHLVADVQCRKV
nr:tRNA wybutosine-synthesizing protein 2/3/4-like [Coffea arabica]